jgi:ribonuclease R
MSMPRTPRKISPISDDAPAPRSAREKALAGVAHARELVLKRLSGEERGAKTRALYNQLGRPLPYGDFVALLDDLCAKGELRKDNLRRWMAGGPVPLLSGILLRSPSGHGFLQPDDGSDKVFLHRSQLDRYLQDDLIQVRLTGVTAPSREGKVTALLERRLERIAGRVARYGLDWIVQPESLRFGGLVRLRGALPPDLKAGEQVRVRLLPDPDGAPLPSTLWVELEARLGAEGGPAWLQERVKAEFNLPASFPRAAEQDAARHRQEDLQPEEGREDLRGACIFTIDPADAKDFDDAVSIRDLGGGVLELGVHIADVSHFVKAGGPLDKEALRRGLSVYLPGEVVPMLPHALSSGLCSLQEGVDRYCFSAIMTVGPRGEVRQARFTPSLIRSRRRFSYDEVQVLLEAFAKGAVGELDRQPDGETMASLGLMNGLWRMLKAQRLQRGGLDFALPEPVFILDEEGWPLEIHARLGREANFLIEEFMLLANRCVAEALYQAKRSCVYRIHDSPGGEKLEKFKGALDQLGVRPVPKLEDVADWQRLLAAFANRPEAAFLQQLTLRTMMKAQYSPHNVGHFGLGFSHYAHFTSPIRRYPDLMVHRLLKALLLKAGAPGDGELEGASRHSSQRELVALEAERAANKQKQILYLRGRLGDECWGRVRGVERFGVFVELEEALAEGMIPIAELPEDWWDYHEKAWELRARRLGRSIRIGDRLLVKILRADPESREVDFRLVEFDGPPTPRPLLERVEVNPAARAKGGLGKGRAKKK